MKLDFNRGLTWAATRQCLNELRLGLSIGLRRCLAKNPRCSLPKAGLHVALQFHDANEDITAWCAQIGLVFGTEKRLGPKGLVSCQRIRSDRGRFRGSGERKQASEKPGRQKGALRAPRGAANREGRGTRPLTRIWKIVAQFGIYDNFNQNIRTVK